MMKTGNNFSEWQERAKCMSIEALTYAIADCVVTSEVQERGGMCGGRYRDEASCYRAEMRARTGNGVGANEAAIIDQIRRQDWKAGRA